MKSAANLSEYLSRVYQILVGNIVRRYACEFRWLSLARMAGRILRRGVVGFEWIMKVTYAIKIIN